MSKRHALVAALIAPLLLALPAMAASNSNYIPLSATAPTPTHLYSNKTYVAKTDLAIMFNRTESLTIMRGNVRMDVSNVRNITLTAGDVINVSKDTPAVLVPVHTVTPMAASGRLIAKLVITKGVIAHFQAPAGTLVLVGRAEGDMYPRFILVSTQPFKWGWWHFTNSGANAVAGALWSGIVVTMFKHTVVLNSASTVYLSISTFVGEWVVYVYSSSGGNDNGGNTLTPNPQPNPNTPPPTSSNNGGTKLAAKLHHKWLIPAVIGVGIIAVIVAVVLTMHPHYHHRR